MATLDQDDLDAIAALLVANNSAAANAVANLNPSGKGADTLGGQIARTYTNSEEAEIIIGAIVQDTVDIQSRLPATLVGGRMDASVGAMANNVITAAAMASDANAEIADAVWDETLTGASHNVATSAGRRLRALADTVILKDGDTVAADNAGSINGTNGLGRIKLQPDVGTVCVGQAVRVSGQVRYIEAYDADTQYATVDSGWCSIPEVGDEYTIFNLRNALIQRIASAGEGTIAYPIAKLWEMLEDSSGYRFTEKALEEAPTGGGGSGTGSFTVTLTIKNNTNIPVPECDVSVTSSNNSSTTGLIAVGRTNASGVVQVQLDEGTYYGWRQKAGYTFVNPFTLVVDSAGAVTIS